MEAKAVVVELFNDLDQGDELERYLGKERVPRHADPLR